MQKPTDKQLREIYNDIMSGLTVLVTKEHFEQLQITVNNKDVAKIMRAERIKLIELQAKLTEIEKENKKLKGQLKKYGCQLFTKE